MRILKLRFKNLNSLAGEWKIDFEDPAFTSDGIFAITGPTGSGKSTILDAICLGLYGRTPRLSRVSGSENEIMARQTGDCFAEVVFSTQGGRYRSFWSQRRAGNKPEGNLQLPSHELSTDEPGTPIATGLRQVAEAIVQVTGMDYDHFTRAMLLAQGRFAGFLQSGASVRADLLEKITGTDLYSTISILVHNRNREEGTTLNLLQAETSGIEVLTEETEVQLRSDLAQAIKEKESLNLDAGKMQAAITWLHSIKSLGNEIIDLEQEEKNLILEVEAFDPEQERLDRAQKAATLEGAFATLMEIRKRQANDQASLEKERSALPHQEEALNQHDAALTASQKEKEEAQKKQESLKPKILKTRALDQELEGISQRIAEADREYQSDVDTTTSIRKQTSEEAVKRQQAETEQASVQTYLKNHLQDEWLVTGLPEIRQKLESIEERQTEIRSLEVQNASTVALRDAAQTRSLNSRELLNQCQEELKNSLTHVNTKTEALDQLLSGKLLREYRTKRDNLVQQQLLLQRIAQLEDHRRQLEDGNPCPLCGSLDHPYAAGNVPEPNSMDQEINGLSALIIQMETLEQDIAKLKEEHLGIQQKSFHAEKTLGDAIKDYEVSENQLAQTQESLSKLKSLVEDLKSKLQTNLLLLGAPDLKTLAPMALLDELNNRLQRWKDHQASNASIADQIAVHDNELARLNAILTTLNVGLIAKEGKLKQLKEQKARLQEERQDLFGDQLPDQVEHLLNESITACEEREREFRESYDEQRDLVTAIKARVTTLQKQISEVAPRRLEEEAAFGAALGPQGFQDEAAFLAARISGPDLETLEGRSKSYKERIADLNTRLKDRRQRLKAERERNITPQSLEILESLLTELKSRLEGFTTTIAQNELLLRRNEESKERVKESLARIEQQQRICMRWGNLDSLIGSSTGNLYRNFVQGLTFEIMVTHANRQLRKMTDRYILIPDSKEALELNVIDNYQAGEKRSTKNLSGGESFIVSLALALGLSQMASKNVRVDSLFLDEGFGTLDEEALETALDTLASLQQEGKLIGVISHVQALKERISTQIQVESGTAGRSSVSGPGVSVA